MTPDWRNTLLLTGIALTISSAYLLTPNENPSPGYTITQCMPECPAHYEDGISWPVLPLSAGIGLTASGTLAWYRGRRSTTAD
ncbi:hypothetical protein [Actinokineospora diospyrosa]|uniref:Secreted protein with PEP-CTERM sorting signal n=1 Tax=Actinokineospora diospyrosa TaxID=103728 RepID=A0ABT1IHN3_9PSEU|nr:hypothetical protein [Actinokineospora diospyrosa]MCP2272074.1 hypothetical protein [Actinokineospora diospyrosa]